ncbi:hypothetical protein ACI3ER_11655 [Bacillus sp. Wb]
MISSKRIRSIEVEILEQELTDAALLKMELSNGEDKAAKKVLRIIDSYNELIRKAKLNKEQNGYIKW